MIGRGIAWVWRAPTKAQPIIVPSAAPRPSFAQPPPRRPLARASLVASGPRQAYAPDQSLEALPYQRQPHLLSKEERAFWFPLFKSVEGKCRIFCKVRLADVICCPPDRDDERRWFKKIRGCHVDFLICDPRTTLPPLVIELDDRRHRERPRRASDEFKDSVLRAAGVPVCRINAETAYDPIELAENIERLINGGST